MTDAPKTVSEAFNAFASGYDATRRRHIPPFDAFYGTAVEALALGVTRPRRILDLGAGTGLLASFVRAAYPDAEITLLDAAPKMLEQARDALGEHHTRFVVGDLTDPLPAGRWDAIVSALAIHHLDDEAKRSLFARAHAALVPGGVFVNAEQVIGPTQLYTDLYGRWHETCARAAGSDDAEWAAAVQRMSHDRCATVEDQLDWLRSAGFLDVDCLFKDHLFAVLVARRGD
jgi:tRNA (cmo5U34)-methyltransferase